MPDLVKTRIDKWLWSVRIFKTRTIAIDYVKNNKVKVSDQVVRPSFMVKVGDKIIVKKEGFNLEFEIVKVIEKRVAYPIAVECYKNITPIEELNKFDDWYVGNYRFEHRMKGDGRPTKRDRREIDDFKTDIIEFDQWD